MCVFSILWRTSRTPSTASSPTSPAKPCLWPCAAPLSPPAAATRLRRTLCVLGGGAAHLHRLGGKKKYYGKQKRKQNRAAFDQPSIECCNAMGSRFLHDLTPTHPTHQILLLNTKWSDHATAATMPSIGWESCFGASHPWQETWHRSSCENNAPPSPRDAYCNVRLRQTNNEYPPPPPPPVPPQPCLPICTLCMGAPLVMHLHGDRSLSLVVLSTDQPDCSRRSVAQASPEYTI